MQEAGDDISYVKFGAHIFKKLNGSFAFNRVDKPNYNDIKIMGVEKIKNPFTYAEELDAKTA